MQQQSLQAMDPGARLLDFTTPFDESKAQALQMCTQAMFGGGKPSDVSSNNAK